MEGPEILLLIGLELVGLYAINDLQVILWVWKVMTLSPVPTWCLDYGNSYPHVVTPKWPAKTESPVKTLLSTVKISKKVPINSAKHFAEREGSAAISVRYRLLQLVARGKVWINPRLKPDSREKTRFLQWDACEFLAFKANNYILISAGNKKRPTIYHTHLKILDFLDRSWNCKVRFCDSC